MNKKGFTLIELLGVIIILSIIMLIAIPNVTSVLEKNKRENYIADAKKMISQVEYEISNGDVTKPASNEIVKVRLSYIGCLLYTSYIGTSDVSKDADGNKYDTENSYVIVVRKNGYLEYYVSLVSRVDGENKGISLASRDELNSDNKLSLIKKGKDFIVKDINGTTGISGTVKVY